MLKKTTLYQWLLCLMLAGESMAQSPRQRQTNFKITQSDFQASMARMEAQVQGHIGVAATVIETGESVAFNGNEHYPMQSVYKFPIGMAALYSVDIGLLRLDKTVTVSTADYVGARQHSPFRDNYPTGTEVRVDELLRYAVSESDGSASDVLMRLAGGAPSVMNYLRSIGVTEVIVKNTEKELGAADSVQYANWATPAGMVQLLRQFQLGKGLSATSRALLLHLMTDTQTGLNRLKGQLPPRTLVAHKTGTSNTTNGKTAATNDVGLITLPNGRHLAVAVFVRDAKADQATRERAIAQIARQLWDRWQ